MVKILFWHAEYRGICLGFLYGGEWRGGDTDCHSQCAHWLRNDTVNKRCGVRADVGSGPYGEVAKGAVKESPSHGFAVPAPFRQGGEGTGDADCHGQFANWPRNDSVFVRSRYKAGGRTGSFAPTGLFWFYLHRKIYISGAKEEYL